MSSAWQVNSLPLSHLGMGKSYAFFPQCSESQIPHAIQLSHLFSLLQPGTIFSSLLLLVFDYLGAFKRYWPIIS